MELVFSPLGKLMHTQLGPNELASCIVIGKSIGSLLTQPSECKNLAAIAAAFGLYVRQLPQYLDSVKLDRVGAVHLLGHQRRKVEVQNTLTGVNIKSVEGLAAFIILICRHISSSEDIMDILQELLEGKFWLVSKQAGDISDQDRLRATTPPLREVLRTFVSSIEDADKDSHQLVNMKKLMTKLSLVIGNSGFLDSVSGPSQHQVDCFLSFLLGNPHDEEHQWPNEQDTVFHTLSAGAAMVALAAATNGVRIKVQCWTEGEQFPTVLTEPLRERHDSLRSGRTIQFNLWLRRPPPEIAQRLSILTGQDTPQPGRTVTGMLPMYGGIAEISRIVAKQIGCSETAEECQALWEAGLSAGRLLQWKGRLKFPSQYRTLSCYITQDSMCAQLHMPPDLHQYVTKYFRVTLRDSRHELAKLAGTVYHSVMKLPTYDGFHDDLGLDSSLKFIIIAIFVGAMGKLASNPLSDLTHYAWSVSLDQIHGYAEQAVMQGLPSTAIILSAARIWGGLPPSSAFEIAGDQMVIGIGCPQITVLVNIASDPEIVASHGLSRGLFTLHQGSLPTVPKHPHSGIILAATRPLRQPIYEMMAHDQVPCHDDTMGPQVLFTLEPVTGDDGRLAALLCAWQHGDAVLELNPYVTLCNLLATRSLEDHYDPTGPPAYPKMTGGLEAASSSDLVHISPTKLLKYKDGFKVYLGAALVRAGGRPDVQIIAAGTHGGANTIMVTDTEDADAIRSRQVLSSPVPGQERKLLLRADESERQVKEGTVIIFCLNDMPLNLRGMSDLGTM